MSTNNNNLQAAAEAHALEVLGKTQFKKNKDAAQSIISDFTAGVQWQALQTATPAPASDEVLAEFQVNADTFYSILAGYAAADGIGEEFKAFVCDAAPALLARVRNQNELLASMGETNRVLAERLKTIADALPGIAKNLTDAVGAADAETDGDGQGDGYENCYNECDNAAAALHKLLRELTPTVKGGQPNA